MTSEQKPGDARKQALAFFERGIVPIPAAYGIRGTREKWQKWQTEKPTKEQIVKWFPEKEARNLNLILGNNSNGLCVVDFDGDDKINGVELYEKIVPQKTREKFLKNTTVVRTGKGIHIYFRYANDKKKQVMEPRDKTTYISKEPLIEVLGKRAMVTCPPSLHYKHERHYEFLNEKPETLPIMVIDDFYGFVKLFQKWVVAAGYKKYEPPKEDYGMEVNLTGEIDITKDTFGLPPCGVSALRSKCPHGERNYTLFWLLALIKRKSYHAIKLSSKDIEVIAADWNKQLDTPLTQQEIDNIIKSVNKKAYHTPCAQLKKFKVFKEGCQPTNCYERGALDKRTDQATKAKQGTALRKQQRDDEAMVHLTNRFIQNTRVITTEDGKSFWVITAQHKYKNNNTTFTVDAEELKQILFSDAYFAATADQEGRAMMKKMTDDGFCKLIEHLADGAKWEDAVTEHDDVLEVIESFLSEADIIADKKTASVEGNAIFYSKDEEEYYVPRTSIIKLLNSEKLRKGLTPSKLFELVKTAGLCIETKRLSLGKNLNATWWIVSKKHFDLTPPTNN